jgi:putative hydrolase of the HAD superfamily
MKAYKHIFFDLDHTLWDFDTNARDTLTDIYGEFEMTSSVNAPFDDFYTRYLHHNQLLWNRYHNGFISAEDLKWKRMWRTLLDFKIGDEALARRLSSRFLEILPTKKEIFPHTMEILKYLTEKKYNLHLITNGFEKTQWSKLTSSGMSGYFTHMITSECSNSLKPKKEIFEFALKRADAELQQSIMIGDNLEADIQGAINAGMDCVYVNHISASATTLPTYTITHLQQLEDIL